jgi:hypothetical protein
MTTKDRLQFVEEEFNSQLGILKKRLDFMSGTVRKLSCQYLFLTLFQVSHPFIIVNVPAIRDNQIRIDAMLKDTATAALEHYMTSHGMRLRCSPQSHATGSGKPFAVTPPPAQSRRAKGVSIVGDGAQRPASAVSIPNQSFGSRLLFVNG